MNFTLTLAIGLLFTGVGAFLPSTPMAPPQQHLTVRHATFLQHRLAEAAATVLVFSATFGAAWADDGGATLGANSKIRNGGASTIVNQRGARKTITRGVQLDGSDFSQDNLSGVSFQQSQIRNGNFKGANLLGVGFFDATLDDSDFEGANLNQANLEMASLARTNLKDAIVTEAYVTGATSFLDANIEGADFTDTFLRKDQKTYLCGRAKGTNPVTGVDTKDSLMCN
mmetsp:Transcript_51541/g.103512  ORF Transcript_51541/g.103512 Transcript_51541/m.103512 type:complete len:227 (+) Transcript_51541:103-783(+)